jgi:cytochrome c heme-lyase
MFYNALQRKGKGDDVAEDVVDAIIYSHNMLNEKTWRVVMAWEGMHYENCPQPRLSRFMGRPDDLSPLARLRKLFYDEEPFDRHDWIVDRCGEEVRYVIDYYFKEEHAGKPEAFDLVVRPAADSVGNILDRIKMGIYVQFYAWGLPCPVSFKKGNVGENVTRATQEAQAGP